MHHLQTIELIILKSNIRKYICPPYIYVKKYGKISLKLNIYKKEKMKDHSLVFYLISQPFSICYVSHVLFLVYWTKYSLFVVSFIKWVTIYIKNIWFVTNNIIFLNHIALNLLIQSNIDITKYSMIILIWSATTIIFYLLSSLYEGKMSAWFRRT